MYCRLHLRLDRLRLYRLLIDWLRLDRLLIYRLRLDRLLINRLLIYRLRLNRLLVHGLRLWLGLRLHLRLRLCHRLRRLAWHYGASAVAAEFCSISTIETAIGTIGHKLCPPYMPWSREHFVYYFILLIYQLLFC